MKEETVNGPISNKDIKRTAKRNFGYNISTDQIMNWCKMNGKQNSFPAKSGNDWDIVLGTKDKEIVLKTGENLSNALRVNNCQYVLCIDKRTEKEESFLVRPFKIDY